MAQRVDDPPIVLALALDRNYVPWTATVILSCLRSNPSRNICFEVVHDGSLTEEHCRKLTEVAVSDHSSLRFHLPGTDVSDLPTVPPFGAVVWLRFLLPDLLDDRSRIIYLDSDILVMSELGTLWATPLESRPIAAVANVVEPPARPHVESLGISDPGGFFNSGVLLMDLATMRSERSSSALLKAARDNRDLLVWPDQDALNLVFARRWLPLHPRWNTQNSFWAWTEWAQDIFGPVMLREATKLPAIRHFEGPGLSKPWHYLCPYPGRKEYRAVLADTPWADVPLLDKTATTRFLKLLPRESRYRAYARLSRARMRLSATRTQDRARQQ